MSDHESTMMDAISDLMAEEQYEEHKAGIQEVLEAALIELHPNEDLDSLLNHLESGDEYGDTFHAAVVAMVDSVNLKLSKEQQTRQKAGKNSGESRREAANEKLVERQEAADPLFRSDCYETKKAVAEEVLKREIEYRQSDRDVNGKEKTPEIISDDEEDHILISERDYLARQLKDPRK
jgi:hypothetical protein